VAGPRKRRLRAAAKVVAGELAAKENTMGMAKESTVQVGEEVAGGDKSVTLVETERAAHEGRRVNSPGASSASGGVDKPAPEEVNLDSDDCVQQVYTMLTRTENKQPYSQLKMGPRKVTVLWDTACTLAGLMSLKLYRAVRAVKKQGLGQVRWFEKPRPVNGISDPPAQLVGQVDITLTYAGRPLKLVVALLKEGDTGKADIMIGNRYMAEECWCARVDIGHQQVIIERPDDGKGEFRIPIENRLNFQEVKTADDARKINKHVEITRELQECDQALEEHRAALRAEASAKEGRKVTLYCREHLVLQPRQAKIVVLQAQTDGKVRSEVALLYLPEDGTSSLIKGVEIADAGVQGMGQLLGADKEGHVALSVQNKEAYPIALEVGDAVLELRPFSSRCSAVSREVPEYVQQALSQEDRALLQAIQAQTSELEGKLHPQGEGGGHARVAVNQLSKVARGEGDFKDGSGVKDKSAGSKTERECRRNEHTEDAACKKTKASFEEKKHKVGKKVRFAEKGYEKVSPERPEVQGPECVQQEPHLLKPDEEGCLHPAAFKEPTPVKPEGKKVRFEKDDTVEAVWGEINKKRVAYGYDIAGLTCRRGVCKEHTWRKAKEKVLREQELRQELWLAKRRQHEKKNRDLREKVHLIEENVQQALVVQSRTSVQKASFEQVRSRKCVVESIDSSVWDRNDVVPVIHLCAGAGGVAEGMMRQADGKYLISAVAVEGDRKAAATHQLNHPEVPVAVYMMKNMEQTLTMLESYLPRKHWYKA
jgi:hypothetical protein